jgi:microcystin degradation protein MlrC
MPFNPDTQSRQTNGRFGAKKAEAKVEAVGKSVVALTNEVQQVATANIKSINEAINTRAGDILILDDPFDYPDGGITNKRVGYLILAAVLALLVVAYVIV